MLGVAAGAVVSMAELGGVGYAGQIAIDRDNDDSWSRDRRSNERYCRRHCHERQER